MRSYPDQDLTYDKSFTTFLSATNEKDIIVDALTKGIVRPGASILDIGAGDGIMTQLLLNRFSPSSYTAIETNGVFCNKLRALGIEAVYGTYPDVDRKLGSNRYDHVLSIYSIPLQRDNRRNFLQAAFSHTEIENGILSIVSFGQQDPFTDMITEISASMKREPADADTQHPSDKDYPTKLREDCALLGNADLRLIESEIVAESPESLYSAVAFAATSGLKHMLKNYADAKDDILTIIERHAPLSTIKQSHSIVTVRRTERRHV